jgi:hypothetical protein
MRMTRISTALAALGLLALADPAGAQAAAVRWAPAPNSIVAPTPNTALDAWEAYKGKLTRKTIEEHLDDPVLKGAIDIHAHFGPDSYDRQWDAFEIAKIARARGMRGLVLKNHWSESAGTAWLVRKYGDVPGLDVFGGLALNATVGGVNPQAVRYFAEVDGHLGRIVWMPTHDSEQEVRTLKENRPYVIVSKNGVLLPSVLEVLDLIAHYKLTLATGHVSTAEMLQIVAEARRRGIDRIVITHPGLGPQYTDPTIAQLRAVATGGTYAEVVASELMPKMKDQMIAMIRAVGPAHVIISSDAGLPGFYSHTDALVHAAQALRAAGFSEADLDLMFKINPAKVLGLVVR